ncbi:MAG: 4Fe-4S binding protein [Alistipes sp.]
MLRKIRIAMAVVFFVLITLLLLDFTGTLHAWLGWMAKVQLLPAVLALNVGVVAVLVVLTLLFGRIYCSIICPLGVLQDGVSWIAGKRKKHRFSYSPALTYLRWGVLTLFVGALIAGIGSLVALLAPYSAYGRIVSNLLAPFYLWGNNLCAYLAERFDSYAFYTVDVWLRSSLTAIIALITCVVIGFLAWRHGRTYCNTICPVGTVLGLLARFSFFKPRFDLAKCNGCKLCARNCKASCIDPDAHTIDYSRCVACMDCIAVCRQGAISYSRPSTRAKVSEEVSTTPHKVDASRRKFLALAGLFAYVAVRAQEKKLDGGLALIEQQKIPNRTTPLVPPGSQGLHHFAAHCTGCQLCVSACTNHVLRPSGKLMTLLQPEMSFERGYCRPECTACSEVCPSGAILPITTADKSATQIGHAVWIRENCVVLTDDVHCGTCARHCPVGAIHMVHLDPKDTTSPLIPSVHEERCIGCGSCENHCPSRPFAAIYVEGHEHHRTI